MTKITSEIGQVSRTGHGRSAKINGVSVDGLEELMEAFAQLGNQAVFLLKEPSTTGAELVASKARSKIHNRTGEIGLGIKVTKPGKQGNKKAYRIFAKVGLRQKTMRGTVGAIGSAGVPLELGHNIVKDGKIVGNVDEHPFLRPASDECREQVVGLIADAMNKALEQMGGLK